MDTFPLVLTLAAVLAVGLALGAVIGVLWARSRPGDDTAIAALQQRVADHAVVQDGLERLQDQLSDLAHDRTAWQAQLHQQVTDVRHSTDVLRQETHTLATALRKPQVRGQWGELHLRRTVELAGLVDHCDFAEQTRLDDGRLRPTSSSPSPADAPSRSTRRRRSPPSSTSPAPTTPPSTSGR